jgi:transcriptional regulator with XRE-family HTH domain
MWRIDHDSGQHLRFAAAAEFSRKLQHLMNQREMSQSDLARLMWGQIEQASGYPAAKNRDRISKWLAGKRLPDGRSLEKLCQILECDASALAPSVVTGNAEAQHPELRMTVIAGHRDLVHLTFNTVLPLEAAVQMIAIYKAHNTRGPSESEMTKRDNPSDTPTPGLAKALAQALREDPDLIAYQTTPSADPKAIAVVEAIEDVLRLTATPPGALLSNTPIKKKPKARAS